MDKTMLMFAAEGEIHWAIVCLIGIVVVFIGLACIIGLVELMTLICNKILEKGDKPSSKSAAPVQSAPAPVAAALVENRGEIVAAVCAAIAEEEGTDISAIRVISFKKVS